jgi:hypothetical protein
VTVRLHSLLLTTLVCLTPSFTLADEDTNWVRIELDARFRAEGSAAADINNDGNIDVVAGDVWYEAPKHRTADHADSSKWTMHEIRNPGEFVAGKGYSNIFGCFTHDIDRDGWSDVIIIGFPGEPFHWYRNPGDSGEHWAEHEIWTSACNESPEFEDIDRDGIPELVLASQPEAQIGFVRLPDATNATAPSQFHAVGAPSGDPKDANNRGLDNGTFRYSHGLGVTDMNQNGHEDVIISHGWWESPGDVTGTDLWKFHPIRVSTPNGEQPLPKCANIYARDFDMDGDADLILSSAHEYGVWWAENPGEGPWILHTIDKSYSQTHAMEEVDVNGDGQLDYVTGKRFFAHNGADPGGNDAVVMYWYEVQIEKGKAPQFIPHEIVAGRDTGVGTQFVIEDVNADGHPDIVLSNKNGVNVLLQKR